MFKDLLCLNSNQLLVICDDVGFLRVNEFIYLLYVESVDALLRNRQLFQKKDMLED